MNTEIDSELNVNENEYSIFTLIKFINTKLLLIGDMISKDDKKWKDYLWKMDIFKLSYHNYNEYWY